MQVKSLEDIPNLGWVGNFGSDSARFGAVDDYIRSEPDLKKRQEASRLASVYGMGEDFDINEHPDYDPLDDL